MNKIVVLVLGCILGVVFAASNLPEPTYAGYIEVNSQYGANLYYYFVESQSNPTTDPLVIWLQGGPGCSSLFGAFVENGPQLITTNGTLVPNIFSWNTRTSVLFIDQPVGTGFSYVNNPDGYVTNENTMAQEMYTFITTFLTMYPSYAALDLYVFGESYAGKYIPAFANEIMEMNSQNPKLFVNLKGIAMGDGWVWPYIQTGSFAPFLYSHGLISQEELSAARLTYDAYKLLVDVHSYNAAGVIGNGLLESLSVAANVDVYDIRYPSNGDPTDPLSDALADYFSQPDVLKAMQATTQWSACNNEVYTDLSADVEKSVDKLLPGLLSQYQVLNYNGNKDLICNMIGTTEWTNSIQWPGQNDYVNSANKTWMVNGQQAGNYRSAGNLTHVIVFDAGHMAPFNQPANTLDLLMSFIEGSFI